MPPSNLKATILSRSRANAIEWYADPSEGRRLAQSPRPSQMVFGRQGRIWRTPEGGGRGLSSSDREPFSGHRALLNVAGLLEAGAKVEIDATAAIQK